MMSGQRNPEKKHSEASLARKELKRRRIAILFIQCAEQLLREEGISGLSTRRLADAAGYSSATLYSYFEDLDELILYASFKYRREYIERVARELSEDMTALEQYRRIYQIFNACSFRDPKIYMNLYFGKHSSRIQTVIERYYHLFPEEFDAPSGLIRTLLRQGSRIECDKITTRRLAEEGVIRPENADRVAEMMVRAQETFIYDLTVHPDRDPEAQNEAFMKLFDYMIAVS
jgi:AcrR family transcriptional regulator